MWAQRPQLRHVNRWAYPYIIQHLCPYIRSHSWTYVNAHRETSTVDDQQKNQVDRKIWSSDIIQILPLATVLLLPWVQEQNSNNGTYGGERWVWPCGFHSQSSSSSLLKLKVQFVSNTDQCWTSIQTHPSQWQSADFLTSWIPWCLLILKRAKINIVG